MSRRASNRTRTIVAAVATTLSLAVLAPAGAQAATTATSIEILGTEYEQGSYSLVSGRLVTTRECRKNRTMKYMLDPEGDGSFRVADAGRSTRNGAFGLLAKLKGAPTLGVAKIVAEPKKVGRTRCGRGVALVD